MVFNDRWLAPAASQRRACSAILSWSRTEYSSLPSNCRFDTSRPTSAAPSRMGSSAASSPPPGRTMGNQPSAMRPTRRSAAGAWPPIQIGIGRCTGGGAIPEARMWW